MINMKNFVKVALFFVMVFVPSHVGSFSVSLGFLEEPQRDLCSLEPDSGPCDALFFDYFYNASANDCEMFIYGGCGGNDNNFENKEACMERCEDNSVSLGLNLKVISDIKDDCAYPKEAGPCRAGITRYYFNGETCKQFVYGGCAGNPNNFRTKEECIEQCVHEVDVGSGEFGDYILPLDIF